MASAIDLEKKELRAQVRRQLNAMTDRERRESDAALFARFLALPQVEAAKAVFAFWGIPGKEPETGALVADVLDLRLRTALPAIALGVLIAGIITTTVTCGVIRVFW